MQCKNSTTEFQLQSKWIVHSFLSICYQGAITTKQIQCFNNY